jgi:hypothetical protein
MSAFGAVKGVRRDRGVPGGYLAEIQISSERRLRAPRYKFVSDGFRPRKMGFLRLSGVRHARPHLKAGEQHGKNAGQEYAVKVPAPPSSFSVCEIVPVAFGILSKIYSQILVSFLEHRIVCYSCKRHTHLGFPRWRESGQDADIAQEPVLNPCGTGRSCPGRLYSVCVAKVGT